MSSFLPLYLTEPQPGFFRRSGFIIFLQFMAHELGE